MCDKGGGDQKNGPGKETVAGRIVKTFGPYGELYITLYDTFTGTNTEEPVFIDIDGIRTPLFFKSFQRRGRNKAVVVFDDIENEHRAGELTGLEFFIIDESRPEDDDALYMENLAGYTVFFEGVETSGKITGFIESDLNPLFEVEFKGREVLVPAADDYIVSFDERKKSMTLRIPEGLLSL